MLLELQPLLESEEVVMVGVDVLRFYGWTTQVQHAPSVAVNTSDSKLPREYYIPEYREQCWFNSMEDGIERTTAIPHLHPAWALADMLKHHGWGHEPGCSGLDPDDIEWDVITEDDEAQWLLACQALNLPAKKLSAMAEYSR